MMTWLFRLMLSLLLIVAVVPAGRMHAQSPEPLLNESFEGAFVNDAAGGAECANNACAVPAGWGVWFVRRTTADGPGINAPPRFEQTRTAGRFKSGAAGLRYFTSQATHTGGIYRILANVPNGAKLRLTAAGQVWSTNDDSAISARPSRDIRLKIGIDPAGGDAGRASPFNPQIVWSPEQSPTDAFKDFSVEAEARGGPVIVYLYSTMKDAVTHNEVFWDDVVLSISTASTDVTPTVAGADVLTPTVAPPVETPTPEAPTNDVTVVVKSGDTLSGIALANGISVEEIQRLNPNLSPQTLQIGDVVIVQKGSPVAAAPPTPTVSAAVVDPALGVTTTVTGTPTVGALCVQAYFDNDGNGRRAEQGEDLVPQVLFTVSKDNTQIGNYTSNGVEEPFCFGDLPNGEYVAAATVLQVYQPTTPLNDSITVRGAQRVFSVGIRRRADAAIDVSPTSTPTPASPIFSPSNIVSVVAVLGGLLMIIGLIGVLIAAFLQRRRL